MGSGGRAHYILDTNKTSSYEVSSKFERDPFPMIVTLAYIYINIINKLIIGDTQLGIAYFMIDNIHQAPLLCVHPLLPSSRLGLKRVGGPCEW